MQGSPYYGSPSPTPSPSLSSSGGSRRVQNAANVYGMGNSSTSGLALRPSPRKLQSYYITPGNGQSGGGRLPSFSPQLSPHLAARQDESSAADKDEETSSPPPAETSAHFQPQAITTAAAYNSPSLFSSKVAQKRFNAGPLYAETDHPVYEDDVDRTPRISGRPFISPSKPSGLSQASPTHTYSNVYPNAVSSRAAYGQENHNGPSLIQRLRVLPLEVQRLFRTRRKKSLSPELHTAPSRGSRQTFRPRRLFLLCLISAVGIYLFWPRRVSTSSISTTPDLDVTNNVTEVSTASVPTRKWWQSPPEASVVAKPPRVRKKATSHASLSHSLTELMALPSRYTLLSDEHWPPTELPTLTIIIDCTETRDPLAREHKEVINHLLASLANDKYPPSAIRLLISPDDYPRTNPGLYGYERGKTSIYTLSPSSEYFLSTPAFSNIETEYLLLLQCPTPHALATDEAENPTFLASLLQVAGNEQYASKALTMSGLSRKTLSVGDNGYVAYGTGKGTIEDGYDDAVYRQLSESRIVDIPYGSLLIQTTWLKSLEVPSERSEVTSNDSQKKSLGLIGKVGRGLHYHLDVKTWALPLALPAVYRTSAYISDFLDFARHLPEDASMPMQDVIRHEAALGSPAKVAVLLSRTDLEFAASWEAITCGFADEAVYGHEVRAFVSDEVEDSQISVLSCPEVEVYRITVDALQAWSPNICLTSSEGYVKVSGLGLSCLDLRLPGLELAHLDWLPALPLESLLNWNIPKIDLAVITNNRPISLHRLLTSLHSAHYLGDNVNLFLNLEQTTDDQTKKVVEGSQWPFGQVSTRHRVVLGGLMTSIVESWYPLNDDTYGVLLEDDVEVSPLFYSWLKFTILHYRYGTKAMRRKTERLYGISLYQPKNIELRPEGRRKFDAHKLLDDLGLPSTLPYLSQIPCSWGAIYFPEHWREFHQFLSIRLSEATLDLADPIVPNIRSNRWPNSWKRYLIELVYLRGYSMLYPNYKDFKSLSTNHLEQGTHVKDESQAQKRRDLFEVPLLSEVDSLTDELPDGILPSWSSLPIIDFWGSLVNEQEIIERGHITSEELELCPKQRSGDRERLAIDGSEQTITSLDHDAAKLLCNGPMDEQDWKEWRMRIQHGANEIDMRMLMEREARLEEREKGVEEMERRLEMDARR